MIINKYILMMDVDTSLMSVSCKQSGCSNLCSVFVYPYCYEHIDNKISEHRRISGQPPQGVYNHLLQTQQEILRTFNTMLIVFPR